MKDEELQRQDMLHDGKGQQKRKLTESATISQQLTTWRVYLRTALDHANWLSGQTKGFPGDVGRIWSNRTSRGGFIYDSEDSCSYFDATYSTFILCSWNNLRFSFNLVFCFFLFFEQTCSF